MRVAAIDCGTNSVRLLIADAGPGEPLRDLTRQMRVVRLGEGVDRTGVLSAQAIERTRLALVDYAELISSADVAAVRMVATSASRDAANAEEFTSMVKGVLGIEPEVVTGAVEAGLSFTGAVAGLRVGDAMVEPQLPLLVADIGGGSSELVLGTSTGGVAAAHSMDVGCVRMTERHLHGDPPTNAEVAATVADLRAALTMAALDVPMQKAQLFIGVAGSVTTVVAIARGLSEYLPDRIHGAVISYDEVVSVTDRLLAMTRAERAAMPVMHPGRVDVIGGGALVLRTIMEFGGFDAVMASEHDILDGIALSLR